VAEDGRLRDLAGETARTVVQMRKRVVGMVPSVVVALIATGCWGGGDSHQGAQQRVSAAVSGVELLPALRVKGMCLEAAGRVGFPIACPAVLPRGSHPFWATGFGRGECDPGSCGPVRLPRWTWVGTYFPTGRGLGHVVVASVPHVIDPHQFVYLIGTITPHRSRRVEVVAKTTVRGHAAEYVRPSLNPRLDPPPRVGGIVFMGQTVLIWSEHGRTYAVGVAGRRIGARAVEAAIARRLNFVRRPSS
jgi:hypothetical protein